MLLALTSIDSGPPVAGIHVTTPVAGCTLNPGGPDTTAKVIGVIPVAVTV
jgi:hypothetical protein